MNILILINSLKYGGAEKQAVRDANSLLQRGHKLTIAFHQSGDLCNLLNKEVKQYRIKSRNEILASFQLLWHLIFNKYDIIHSHMFWAEKVSSLSGKLTGHKVILNEHGLGLWRKWYHIFIMKFISLFADKIINSCDATKSIRRDREKLNKNKLLTIYNSFELNIDEYKEKFPEFLLNKNSFIIGFVGRFNKVKRLEIFIKLAKRLEKKLSNFKIVLVGDGPEKVKLVKLIEKHKLESLFILPGFITNISNYYKSFNVFVLPSIREANSVALLEASSLKIPCIAFDVGGNSEIIQNNVTGFIIPDNEIDLLVEKILFLYNNSEKREKIGDVAGEFVNFNFSIERRIKKLEALYKAL